MSEINFTATDKIGVVGCGAMGSGIAQVAATNGHRVLVFDSSKVALLKAEENLKNSLSKLVEKGKITQVVSEEIFSSIEFVSDIQKLKESKLIIEAIIENLEIKQKVFTELESITDSECILASNTSSLSITSIAAACKRPEKVIGIHFLTLQH